MYTRGWPLAVFSRSSPTSLILPINRGLFIVYSVVVCWCSGLLGSSQPLKVWPHSIRCFLRWVLSFLTQAHTQHLLKKPAIKGSENLPLRWWGLDFCLIIKKSVPLSFWVVFWTAFICSAMATDRCLWQLIIKRRSSSFRVKVNSLKTLRNHLSSQIYSRWDNITEGSHKECPFLGQHPAAPWLLPFIKAVEETR